MKAGGFTFEETIRRQQQASHPDASAWVRANAGSGKTHVLAQRVIRLLLQGVPPSKILCLTFTKAAAANMSLRIFKTLARWAVLDDGTLTDEIAETGSTRPANLDDARRLFVRTVETPGGLKVQTIHAFCERLLHLFPFESNVSAHFEAIEDDVRRELMAEARLAVMNGDNGRSEPAMQDALTLVSETIQRDAFEELLTLAIGRRASLRRAQNLQANGLQREFAARFGLPPNQPHAALLDEILADGLPKDGIEDILSALAAGSAKDLKLENALRAALALPDARERAEAYLNCFLNKSDRQPLAAASFGTKKIPDAVRQRLQQERTRIVRLRELINAAAAVERTMALYRIADAVRARYEMLKAQRGYLDFDDLIERTRTLLRRSDAAWVLYKLDAGIDHILIDEAQDTSPAQWDILGSLTGEFFGGASARPGVRTFFAVGDEKQSIFSFQGAAPHEFGKNLAAYRAKITEAKFAFEDVELKMSFRSSQTILGAVDCVFRPAHHRAGLSVDDEAPPAHHARHARLPGYVEFAPMIEPEKSDAPADWRLPLDRLDEKSPAARMAYEVAAKIQALLDPANRHAVHEKDLTQRAVTAGDIMILVRKRGDFFNAVIRALKECGAPVAGADRLDIVEHIAVMDLMAAGQVALLPQDDLTLATVLKSPLIGLDDDDLITLAPGRRGSLIDALAQSTEERHKQAADKVRRWQAMARSHTPFEFFSILLGAERGRLALLSRLGPEANDAIDEFLALALEEAARAPLTLTQFLDRLTRSGLEIKRDMEGAGAAVRVMTVHAAKGLEAKIVFLPDTVSKSGGRSPQIVDLDPDDEASLFVWRTSKEFDPSPVTAQLAAMAKAAEEEERRLLYVAMTRAEERLYIGGYRGAHKAGDLCWYKMIETTLGEQPDAAQEADGCVRIGLEAKLTGDADRLVVQPKMKMPAWIARKPPQERSALPPVRPSTALDSADQQPAFVALEADPGDSAHIGRTGGAAIGTLAHELLYRLPMLAPAGRHEAALRYLEARAAGLHPAMRANLADRIIALIADPALAVLFGAQSRAEVAIAGQVARKDGPPLDVAGRIDRLCVLETEIVLADFKTGSPRQAERTPAAYVRQMALYKAVVQALFPNKTVRAWLVWTGGPEAVELPDSILSEALDRVTQSPGA